MRDDVVDQMRGGLRHAPRAAEYDAGNGKKARRWTRIGAAFPHKEGPGLNVELRALPIDGRIVLLPPDREGTDAKDRK